MNAIILCGGLSTRLGDIAKTTPKVLLEINGKTVLEWQLEQLKKIGVTTVVLAARHLAAVLQGAAGQTRGGVHLRYALEKERLGTGGAIRHAWQYVPQPEEPVIILNGDILTTADLGAMRQAARPDSEGIILAVRVTDTSPYGTLEFDSDRRLVAFKEKEAAGGAGYINGGVYILQPAVRSFFPAGVSSLEYDVFPRLKNLYVYQSSEPWVDIGVPERLAWARANWK